MQIRSAGSHPDSRTPITMWNLLIWAYKRQMVHYEVDRHEPTWKTNFLPTSSTYRLGAALELGWHARGSINGGGTTAHEDAHIVHSHVMRLVPADRDLIIRTAERGDPPNPEPPIEPLRVVPVRKGGVGNIRMLYRSGRPIACLIDYEGIPEREMEEIRESARETHTRWWRSLHALSRAMCAEKRLSRWNVQEVGAG